MSIIVQILPVVLSFIIKPSLVCPMAVNVRSITSIVIWPMYSTYLYLTAVKFQMMFYRTHFQVDFLGLSPKFPAKYVHVPYILVLNFVDTRAHN